MARSWGRGVHGAGAGQREAVSASDQYSLGCLLFELLTGKLPFVGVRRTSALLHATQPPPRRGSSVRRCARPGDDLSEVSGKGGEQRYATARRWRRPAALGRRASRSWPGGSGRWNAWSVEPERTVEATLVDAVAMLLVVGSLVAWGWRLGAGEKTRADTKADEAEKAEGRANQKTEDALRERNAGTPAWHRGTAAVCASLAQAQREWQDGKVGEPWRSWTAAVELRQVEYRFCGRSATARRAKRFSPSRGTQAR